MDDFLITTLYEYNRISAEDCLLHSWGKKPEQKKAEKKYNHWYYEKFKDKWKTKYNKNGIGASSDTRAEHVPKNPKRYTGVAYDYVSKSSSDPHLDMKSVDITKKITRALKIGAEAVIGIGGFIGGAALTTVIPTAGIGMMTASAAITYNAGSKIVNGIVGEIRNTKYKKQREKEPIDSKTGFHVKTENLSPEEDIKRVNPQVNDLDAGTKNNCMLCTVSYDLRRRGYDVQANKADTPYYINDISRWYKNAQAVPIKNSYDGTNIDSGMIMTNFEDAVKKQGNGASGIIVVEWSSNGGGHAMHYEYRDGKIYLSDPQTGKIYNDPRKILKKSSGASIMRLDDKEVNWETVKECCS